MAQIFLQILIITTSKNLVGLVHLEIACHIIALGVGDTLL